MNGLKTNAASYFCREGVKKKFALMMAGVLLMGFFVSFLIDVNLGTDPCTFMNVTISERLHLSFGNWQAIFNIALLLVVIAFDREQIGLGTVANMFLIGYVSDFFRMIWSRTHLKEVFLTMPYRGIIFTIALLGFVVAASFYMNADMGVSPYDAVPNILYKKIFKKFPFKFVRMGFDFTIILIGCLFGGIPNVGIIAMALLLGPTISFVGNRIKNWI